MHQTENDLMFLIIAACSSLGIFAFFFVIVIINYYRVNVRKRTDIYNAVFETQLRERNRISEDLHDELGLFLSGIRVRLSEMHETEDKTEKENLFIETKKSLDEAVQQVRVITHNLMPRHLEEHGLITVLEELKILFEKSQTVKINFEHSGLDERLNAILEINIYRIINEIVNNALKHAQAGIINIQLDKNKNGLNIIVSDNGKGFKHRTNHDGIGLKNIESRINLFNGKYRIVSSEKTGTKFIISFDITHLPKRM